MINIINDQYHYDQYQFDDINNVNYVQFTSLEGFSVEGYKQWWEE